MALGISTESGGGDFLPIIKYDARAGRVFRVDRTSDGNGWSSDQVDITGNFKAIFDMDNIEVGWMSFNSGSAPDFKLVALGQNAGPRPSDGHREGFRVTMKLGKDCGGDVRELASTAKVVIGAFDALHDAYLEGVKKNPGKLPIVTLTGSKPIQTNGPNGTKTTNYAPAFEIKGWAARPADLGAKPRGNGNAAAHPESKHMPNVPPTTGSTQAPPPDMGPKPPPADEEDFG